jgi:hypothetical protein
VDPLLKNDEKAHRDRGKSGVVPLPESHFMEKVRALNHSRGDQKLETDAHREGQRIALTWR